MTAADDLTLAEGTCLALVISGHRHGWAMVRELAPDGEIGRIWSLSRALTYRTIDQLVAKGLLERAGTEPGAGRTRALLAATPAGRRAGRSWVMTPVAHLRDVRTELLVKLTLGARLGVDRTEMLRRQRDALTPIIEANAARRPNDLVQIWRAESSAAIDRFLARAATVIDDA